MLLKLLLLQNDLLLLNLLGDFDQTQLLLFDFTQILQAKQLGVRWRQLWLGDLL